MRILFTFLLLFLFLSPNSFSQVADPASIPVYRSSGPITVDGLLNEPDWSEPVEHLMFKLDAVPSGLSNTPTNAGVVVKPPYTDTSTCYVRFLKDGLNLYISLQSDDKQVCRFDWEGDGLFMKINDATAAAKEYKIYVGAAATFVFETNGPAGSSGAGVANGTIYDSTDVDNGYTAELQIDLASLGFTSETASVEVMLVIFDPDNYSLGAPPWGPNGNYAKQWWGSEWGPETRTLQFMDIVVPVELTSFKANYAGSTVQLNWSTATETNNKGFDIERSVNNSAFSSVGFIEGIGTSTKAHNYSFIDKDILPGVKYSYRLKQIDLNGQFTYSQVIELGVSQPVEYAIQQNYPNPFNPSTRISFSLPVKSNVTLDIYNLLGQRVMTLFNGSLDAGVQELNLDASGLNSGMYIYTITASGEDGSSFTSSRKMTLIK